MGQNKTWLLLFVFVIPCAKKDEDSSSAPVSSNGPTLAIAELNGVWGKCDTYYNRYLEVSFQDGAYTARAIEYDYSGQEKCLDGKETHEYVAKGLIKEGERVEDYLDISFPTLDAVISLTDYEVIYYNQDDALYDSGITRSSFYEKEPICNDTVFTLNIPLSIMGKSCAKYDAEPKLLEPFEYKERLGASEKGLYYTDKMFVALPTADSTVIKEQPRTYIPTQTATLLKLDAPKKVLHKNALASVNELTQTLQGTWEFCDFDNRAQVTLAFDGNTYTQTATIYAYSVDCYGTNDPDDRRYRLTFTGSFNINAFSSVSPGAFEIDWTKSDTIMEPLMNTFTDSLNATGASSGGTPFCSDQTFTTGQPQSLVNKNCKLKGDTYAPVVSDTLYDIMFFHIRDKILYDSLPLGTDAEGTSVETRSKAINWSSGYKKK